MTQQPRTPGTEAAKFAKLVGDLRVEPDPVYWNGFRDGCTDLLAQIEKAVLGLAPDRGDAEWDTVVRADVIAVLAAIRAAAPVEPTPTIASQRCTDPDCQFQIEGEPHYEHSPEVPGIYSMPPVEPT